MKIELIETTRSHVAEIQPDAVRRFLNSPEPEMPDWDEYLTEYLRVFGFIHAIPLGELVRLNSTLLS